MSTENRVFSFLWALWDLGENALPLFSGTLRQREHRDKGVSGKLKVLQRVAKSHNMMRSIFSHKILSGLVCAIFG